MCFETFNFTSNVYGKDRDVEAWSLSPIIDTSTFSIDEDELFGCDYATVAVTTKSSVIDGLKNLLTEEDFKTLQDDMELDHIIIVTFGDVFIVNIYPDYINENAYDYIQENMVVFGSDADDVPINECIKGYEACIGITEDDLDDYHDHLATVNENRDCEDEEDDLECSVDFYSRIVEYTEDRGMVDTVMKSFTEEYNS